MIPSANGEKRKDISVVIAGKAGDGVLFTGNTLAKILKRQGWEVVTTRDFPSNIRGEATNYIVRASQRRIYGRSDSIDILLAFDCDAVFRHVRSVAGGGIVLCDGEGVEEMAESIRRGKAFHRFMLRKMARENFGQEIFKNMIALGALSYILTLDCPILEKIIAETFLKRKGKDIVEKNIQAVNLGWKAAGEIIRENERHPLTKMKDRGRLILSGDEAIALGSLAAGCRFISAYPICPASEIWQSLAVYLPGFNGAVIQTEDELAAIHMALGASYAGARAMTSTSGPGASLMMEAFSLAGMAEIPVVIVHVQRLGPATGIPTKSQQGDLLQWIFGGHGEFPRIVLSPGTIEECFAFTAKAFHLAEQYQCPVVVLIDEDMGQNLRTARRFNFRKIKIRRGKLLSPKELLRLKNFKRYEFTADGISRRAIPGTKNGLHMVEGNEHDERGYRDEDPTNRRRMMEKRMKKLKSALKDRVVSRIWGDQNATIGIMGTGSTIGPILEAMSQLRSKGVPSRFLQLRTLWPFPANEVENFLKGCRHDFVVENNFTGQLAGLVRSQVQSIPRLTSILKYSTLPFKPGEISRKILRAFQ
ncbi:MAG: 2-oxoacid:acceptor oxidoreductase subunit alpha [Candidatus Aminicenantales bacterium]